MLPHRLARAMVAGSALFCAALLGPAPLRADHWMQTADPQVVNALNELVQVYGGWCRQGNPAACEMVQSVQQHGGAMLNAGYDCQVMGNARACAHYQGAYAMLETTYAQTQQALAQQQMQQAPMPQQNPLGATHQERMMAIQNWGQERLQWGQQNSARMDANHAAFMETLRN